MSAGWKAIRWAKTVPPVRRKDGKPDSVAQHVLLVLATFADKEGRARPGLSTLTSETYLSDDTVDGALSRLENAKLISRGGSFNGTTVWMLNLSVGPDGAMDGELQERRERARIKRNERQQRYADRRKMTVPDTVSNDGAGDRHLTVSDTVSVESAGGAAHRQMTVPDTVTNGAAHRQMTVPTSSSPQVTPAVTAIELPLNCQGTATIPESAQMAEGRAANGTPCFEDFYSIYPRKRAPADARKAWDKIVAGSKKAPAVDPAVIVAGARRFAAERAGENPKFTPYPASWLNDGCWADEPDRPPSQKSSGYQPWANPADQSAYDEELLP